MKKRMLLALALAVLMALSLSASALQYYSIDVPYPGKAAFTNDVQGAVINVDGVEYDLTDKYAGFSPESFVQCESTYSVYECLTDDVELYQNTLLGVVIINAPGNIIISVYEGNRETGDYFFTSYQLVEGIYYEGIFPSTDEDTGLLVTDKLYLYEYEEDGQAYNGAMHLYINYSGMYAQPLFSDNYELSPMEIIPDEDFPAAEITVETDDEIIPDEITGEDGEDDLATPEVNPETDAADEPVTGPVENSAGFNGFFSNVIGGVTADIMNGIGGY